MFIWNLTILIAVMVMLSYAKAEPAECSQLRSLNQQYRGVALSPSEKVAKAQMVSWYRANCKKPKRAR